MLEINARLKRIFCVRKKSFYGISVQFTNADSDIIIDLKRNTKKRLGGIPLAINSIYHHNTSYHLPNQVAKSNPATVKQVKDFLSKPTTSVSISEEGQAALREKITQMEKQSDHVNDAEITPQKTNEVAWEHYTAMRVISSQTLKNGNYNAEDVMKSIMDTYETRYNEIIKKHENGDREVSYELTGKRTLTLDEDLAGLDEAYKMRLTNLAGYITCQQTNKAFENPDSSWYFHRNGL